MTPRLVLIAFLLSAPTASCALPFPDYDVESLETTTTTGAGGTGGSVPAGSDGTSCESPDECLSGSCLENNTGPGRVCCARDCKDDGPLSCGTNGKCDASGADCALYPAGVDCGDATCADGELTAQQCKAAACEPGPATPCGGGLGCLDATACQATCVTSAECANPSGAGQDAECIGGECTQRPDGTPCEANDQCDSGKCGTTGVGHCCATSCAEVGEICGATDCDLSGACVYPETDAPCGTDPSCENANLSTVYCSGDGFCSLESTQPCAGHLGCESATACYATCGSNDATGDGRCPSGYWCDGSTCQQASWDEGSACLRNGQCSSDECASNGRCTAAGCDVDNDGFVRDDPHCAATEDARDCDDNDARAHPGQTEFFATPRSAGGYDFDCSGAEEPEQPTSCLCGGYALLVPPGSAGCGVTGTVRTCFLFFLCGVNDTANTATQLCR